MGMPSPMTDHREAPRQHAPVPHDVIRPQTWCILSLALRFPPFLSFLAWFGDEHNEVDETPEPTTVEQHHVQHEALQHRQSLIASGTPPIEINAPRQPCSLSFVARWLLFLLFFMMSLSRWPNIEGFSRALPDSEPLISQFVPTVGNVRETAMAAREAVIVCYPEENAASRLLETLFERICALY